MITMLIVGGIGGILALLGIKKSGDIVGGLFKKDPKKEIVQSINENHAVSQQEQAAQTDKEVDDALDADAKSDHS